MIHCIFDTSRREKLRFATTSEVLLEKYLIRYKVRYPYDKPTIMHVTNDELVDYHNRDTQTRICWCVDEVLEFANSDIYCYVIIDKSDKGDYFLSYEIDNEDFVSFSSYKNYIKGSHSNVENLIRDLDSFMTPYCKLGLDDDAITSIYTLELDKLLEKYNIKLWKDTL